MNIAELKHAQAGYVNTPLEYMPALTRELEALDKLGGKALAQQRYQMFRAMGQNLPPAGEEVL